MGTIDAYHNVNTPVYGPGESAFAITASDTADLAYATRALLVATAGNLKVDMKGVGTGVTLPLQVGITQVMVTKVYATGSDADPKTGLIGIF